MIMTKALIFFTVLLTASASGQGRTAVQRLVFKVSQINKGGFSRLPHDDQRDDAKQQGSKENSEKGSKQNSEKGSKENSEKEASVARTSFSWVSTSDGKKVSIQTTGSSRIIVIGGASANTTADAIVQNTTAAGLTLSTIAKSGSIDLAICREPVEQNGAADDVISRIVSTLTSS